MSTLEERVAVVEFELKGIKDDLDEFKHEFETHRDKEEITWSEVKAQLTAIELQLSKQQSFVGGMLFVITAVWSFVTLFKDNVFNFFK